MWGLPERDAHAHDARPEDAPRRSPRRHRGRRREYGPAAVRGRRLRPVEPPDAGAVDDAPGWPTAGRSSAGTRAYSIGFEDGRFYANGWHITGEMGGIWTPPVKLLDGVWFGLDGQWVGPATTFTSGWGYTRYDLPTPPASQVQRTDVVPDGRRGVLFGLTITNPGAARTAKLSVDAHSELMGQYPVGLHRDHAQRQRQPARHGQLRRPATSPSPTTVRCPGRPTTTTPPWSAPSLKPDSGAIGDAVLRARSPGTAAPGTEPGAPADPKPSACDDGPFGNGTGGELTYSRAAARRRFADGLARRRRLRPGLLGRRSRSWPGRCRTRRCSSPPKIASRRRGRADRPSSPCPATRCCSRRSTGASRTSPTSP